MSFIWNFLRRKFFSQEETEEELLKDANVSVSSDVNVSITDDNNIYSHNYEESFVTSLDEMDQELNETVCTAIDEETKEEFSLIDNIYERFLMTPSNDLDKNAGALDLPTGIDVTDMTLQQDTEEDESASHEDTEFKSQKPDDATEIESSDQGYFQQDMPILTTEQNSSEKQDIFRNKKETIEAMKLNFNSKRKRSYSETYDGAGASSTKKLMWNNGCSVLMSSNLPGTSHQWIETSYEQRDMEEQTKKNLWEEFVAGLDMKCNEAQKLLAQTSQIPKSLPMFDCLLNEIKIMIDMLENYPKVKLAGSKLSCTINVLISRQTELEKARAKMMPEELTEESGSPSTVSKSDQDDEGSANDEALGNVNTAGSILNKITTLAMKALTVYRKMCEAPRLSRKQRRKFEEELIECCNSLKSLEEFIEEANEESAYLDALNFCTQTVGPTSPQSKFI
ncbi:hypothetical protein B566_EDAN013750 [Ephemera danica]|nr:hypothetical protein B566_EDAN013750 [Ephemera danica]